MKISFDGEEILDVSDHMIKVLLDYIPKEELEADLKRRLVWIVEHLYDTVWENFSSIWVKKLMANPEIQSMPSDRDAFVDLVRSQPDYKDASARKQEELASLEKKAAE